MNGKILMFINSGQLGTGNNNSYYTPQQVIVSGDASIKSIVCGTDCSVIVTNKGNILGCGSNRYYICYYN